MKQKLEIEVDVPDGFEIVGFGNPEIGEYGFDIIDCKPYGPFNQYDISPTCRTFSNTVRLKKKKEYKWPDFIQSGSYLCMNKSGRWWLSVHKPSIFGSMWADTESGYIMPTSNFIMSTPDTPSDWTNSLIRKP